MGYRLSKIYTRKGDDGSTSLDASHRIPKDHLRIETIGTIDELNCAIGIVLSLEIASQEILLALTQIQQELFNLGGELCLPQHSVITEEKVTTLEKWIDEWNQSLPPLKEFILPGGTPASAQCHLARAICRRAERRLVSLHTQEPINPNILRYVNRLSDALFVAARILMKEKQVQEVLWEHEREK